MLRQPRTGGLHISMNDLTKQIILNAFMKIESLETEQSHDEQKAKLDEPKDIVKKEADK